MKTRLFKLLLFYIGLVTFNACEKQEETNVISSVSVAVIDCGKDEAFVANRTQNRNYNMGFTTWSYGPKAEDVSATYEFIKNYSDIYTEHIDANIPWNAWINETELPTSFKNEIQGKAAKKINGKKLLLSVSLLNSERTDLAEDVDGTIPEYTSLDDANIEEAYFKHIQYLVNAFNPEYLVLAIEANELRLRAETKWAGYTALMDKVTARIKTAYPNLKLSESISLHNLYQPEIANPEAYIDDIVSRMNTMDFIAVSFYPFLKNLYTKADIQQAFDFLHSKAQKPIAFVETGQIAENLVVENLDVNIKGDECGQNDYLEVLLANAQLQNYEFVIWWAHRDYDALWKTFPDAIKDVGKLWKDTGLLNESGKGRLSFKTWTTIFNTDSE